MVHAWLVCRLIEDSYFQSAIASVAETVRRETRGAEKLKACIVSLREYLQRLSARSRGEELWADMTSEGLESGDVAR